MSAIVFVVRIYFTDDTFQEYAYHSCVDAYRVCRNVRKVCDTVKTSWVTPTFAYKWQGYVW